MNLQTTDLRYPIGKILALEGEMTRDRVAAWIGDIAALPADLQTYGLAVDGRPTGHPVPSGWLDRPASGPPPGRQPHEQLHSIQVGADGRPARDQGLR